MVDTLIRTTHAPEVREKLEALCADLDFEFEELEAGRFVIRTAADHVASLRIVIQASGLADVEE